MRSWQVRQRQKPLQASTETGVKQNMKKYLDKVLPSVVFLTGASVLIVEVVATRVLSPYFGNTIYTFSSVIGVILAALSLGYYFGGKLADKHPKIELFFFIIIRFMAKQFLA